MAYIDFKNVRIAGISGAVPQQIKRNLDVNIGSDKYEADAFVKSTGVFERHVSDHLTAFDLCLPAAEKIIQDLNWNKSEIGAVIFVCQFRDYILPAMACMIQEQLGLSKDCYAEDISMGCSGWAYGLSTLSGLMQSGQIKKALLLNGEAKRLTTRDEPLMGHAGTVTALEYAEGADGLHFYLGTDGSGFDALIVPDGGVRNRVTPQSFEVKDVDGHLIDSLQTHMKGMDVFAFGISMAPKAIKRLAEHMGVGYDSFDYYVLHQANMKMNQHIMKKLKMNEERCPSSLYHFGNTSSASIPLTMVNKWGGGERLKKKVLFAVDSVSDYHGAQYLLRQIA